MDLSKLSIEYIDSFESTVTNEGYTQTDKILPYLSIVYPYRGFYEVKIEDDPLSLLPDSDGCFIVPPQVRHTIVHHIMPGESCMIPRWLFFTVLYNDCLDVTSWFRPPLIVTGKQAEPFKQAIDELYTNVSADVNESTHEKAFRKLRIAGTVLENLLVVSEFKPAELQMERIYPAIVLVRNHFDKHITVEMMANECHMSVSVFFRTFRRTTQKSPMEYLNDYRLKQVAHMLISEDLTLSGIAARCGFYDEFHLSRNFKNSYGVSPKEYKKRTPL